MKTKMKIFRILLPLFVAMAPSVVLGCDACSMGGVPEVKAPARYPLKGAVVETMADQSALLVKHEEIPGVMKAMTMLLKVDAAALASVKKGDAVTGQLVRKADGWWLEEVKAAESAK
jgi:Cu/Ag efflux protein CusF